MAPDFRLQVSHWIDSEQCANAAMLEVITDRRSLAPLKPFWDALAGRHESPLLGFDWFVSCIETLHAADPIRIVLVREAGDIRAIAPLCVVRRDGVETLELIGASALYEPSGLLYADAQGLAKLLVGVAGLGLPVVLLRLPCDPVLQSCLRDMAWRRAIVLSKRTAPAVFLRLPESWDDFLGRLSSSRRYEFRRKRKCLEKTGVVTTRIVNPALSELPALLQDAVDVEDSGWKGRGGSSLHRNPALRAFFECYLTKACANGLLRLCYLDIDGQPVSMHIAIESHAAFWVLKLGHDDAYAKCSPGTQLALETIEYSVRQGLSRYEFLGSEEAWQHAWPVERREARVTLMYPYSSAGFRGLGGLFLTYGKTTVRRLLRL